MSAETEYQESLTQLRKMEQLKHVLQDGVSSVMSDTSASVLLERLDQFQQSMQGINFTEVVSLLKERVRLLREQKQRDMAQFSDVLDAANTQFMNVQTLLQGIAENQKRMVDELQILRDEVVTDFQQRALLRSQQMQTLAKIDAYLEAWR